MLALALVALAIPASAGATSWTQIGSGTTSTITAVEYQSPTRFWFTTANGAIFTRAGNGAFTQTSPATGIPLNDIEFLPAPSEIGMAVGNGGQVRRTTNGGASWENVSAIPVSETEAGASFPDCTAAAALGDVNAVRFAGPTRVWIMAEGSQLARSASAAPTVGATGTWIDANWLDKGTVGRSSDDLCKVEGDIYNEGFGDAFFAAANPEVGYFCVGSFHNVFFTTNSLSSVATKKPGSCGNGGGPPHLAGDPDDPGRMWAVTPGPYGVSMTARTTDGWSSSSFFTLVNIEKREFSEAADVDYAAGTVLSAGAAGMILVSKDGSNFYYNDATGSLATTGWSAVSLADAENGAVGGEGGALAVTTDASNVSPSSGGAGGNTPPAKDVKPPETTITKKPKKKSAKRKATFEFTSSEKGSTFECKFDKAKRYAKCTSPLKKKVKPGRHTFFVRAVDAAGNADASPAAWSFKVKAPKKHRG